MIYIYMEQTERHFQIYRACSVGLVQRYSCFFGSRNPISGVLKMLTVHDRVVKMETTMFLRLRQHACAAASVRIPSSDPYSQLVSKGTQKTEGQTHTQTRPQRQKLPGLPNYLYDVRRMQTLASRISLLAEDCSSNCMVSVWPLLAASMRAVLPCTSCKSLSAPACKSNCAIDVCPFLAASIKAVLADHQSCKFVSAPAFSSNKTICVWPSPAALVRAVMPAQSSKSLSAPACNSNCTISVWPWLVASMRAVAQDSFWRSMLAPACSSSLKISTRPPRAAHMRAVVPDQSCKSLLAPACNSLGCC